MREAVPKHQVIEYLKEEPFYIANVRFSAVNDYYAINSHWHEELEIAYILEGNPHHYIDGECIQSEAGRLIVTNSESVHHVTCEFEHSREEAISAVVLLIHNRFIIENFPEYGTLWFTNNKRQTKPEIRDIMLWLSAYAEKKEHRPQEHLYVKGLLLQLLYYMYEEGIVSRKDQTAIVKRQNIQPLKDILVYVEEHYQMPLAQADVANQFYLSQQYFSRYFKQCTGITFTEHITRYRLEKAIKELRETDKRIVDIALDNGFTEERRFAFAFKKFYGVSPLQYRRQLHASDKKDDFIK